MNWQSILTIHMIPIRWSTCLCVTKIWRISIQSYPACFSWWRIALPPDNIGHTRDLFTLPYFLNAFSFALKHILAVFRIITDLPDGKHYDKLHILKRFFFCFAYSEPERSDISGYKIKVELFTEITDVPFCRPCFRLNFLKLDSSHSPHCCSCTGDNP